MAPFYGWGSTASRLEPLWEGSLLFTTNIHKLYTAIYINSLLYTTIYINNLHKCVKYSKAYHFAERSWYKPFWMLVYWFWGHLIWAPKLHNILQKVSFFHYGEHRIENGFCGRLVNGNLKKTNANTKPFTNFHL